MMSTGSPEQRSARALADVDLMPPDLRECVHEYGYAIVKACIGAGVRRPRAIHKLVTDIWQGARQPDQKSTCINRLDWLLIQRGANLSAAELCRFLVDNGYAIISALGPTREMVEASMATISNFDQAVTKKQKHFRRLQAAFSVAMKQQKEICA